MILASLASFLLNFNLKITLSLCFPVLFASGVISFLAGKIANSHFLDKTLCQSACHTARSTYVH